ncbi:MAG TPA: sigma factor [Trebonia sp.]
MTVGKDPGPRSGDAEPSAAQGKHRRRAAGSVDSLLRRAAQGDTEAFASICDQVDGAVYGVVSRITGDQVRAQQVTEDVLLEIWQSASQFSPAGGSGLNWIMTMARRRALSQAGGGPAARPGSSPAAGAGAERTAGNLSAHRGIASLPGPERDVVLMASCGYTWHQLAERAQVPDDTVAEWLRDGLLKLSSHSE